LEGKVEPQLAWRGMARRSLAGRGKGRLPSWDHHGWRRPAPQRGGGRAVAVARRTPCVGMLKTAFRDLPTRVALDRHKRLSQHLKGQCPSTAPTVAEILSTGLKPKMHVLMEDLFARYNGSMPPPAGSEHALFNEMAHHPRCASNGQMGDQGGVLGREELSPRRPGHDENQPRGNRTPNRPAAHANREPRCSRHIGQPSLRGRARLDGGRLCTKRSAGPGPRRQHLGSLVGRDRAS